MIEITETVVHIVDDSGRARELFNEIANKIDNGLSDPRSVSVVWRENGQVIFSYSLQTDFFEKLEI